MDNEGCLVMFAMALCALVGAFIGYEFSEENRHEECSVVKSIKAYEGKLIYETSEFVFVSDSVYCVGDTVKIVKK